MEAAQAMRGKVIELYREDIDDEVIFAAELIGVEVYADGALLGKITDVLDYPGNSVYVVTGEHEYMIPAVKQFILYTDLETNTMQVKIIEGMRSDEN
jgi:16S rRNA processing protein RimM